MIEIKDMTVEELETRKAEIGELIEQPDAELDQLETEVRAINEEIEARKQAEAKKAEIRSAVASGDGVVIEKLEEVEERKTMDVKEIRNSDAYIEAFARYVKTNDATECRALLSDNASGGAVPVPDFVGGIVAERLKESKILARVRKMNAAGNVKIGFEISAPMAAIHEEGETVNEEELTLGIVTLTLMTLKKWVSISDEALDSMSGQAYLEYIYDEVARGIVKAAEFNVLGYIINSPAVASATAPSVPTLTVQHFGIADFVNARALLGGGAEDLVIIVSPSDYAAYRAIQMGSNYGADPFDGLEVIISEHATKPIIGDLAGVLANYPKGDAIEFKYDDKTDMTKDLVRILGRQPVAIGVVGDKFFATINNQNV